MKDNQSGPVIFVKNEMIDTRYISIIDMLIEQKKLKPSFRIFIDAMNTACLHAEHSTSDGYFIRFFDVCTLVEGKLDPDYKKPCAIKVASRVARYSRLNALNDIGIITKFFDEKKRDVFYPREHGKSIGVYNLEIPNIGVKSDSVIEDKKGLVQLTSEYRQARKVEGEQAVNMDFGYYAKPLEQLGSMDILATYFNDCIRASSAITAKVIQKDKRIRNPETGKIGSLSIETTTSSSENAEIMLGDDMVLLNYFYSSINERLLSNFSEIRAPFQNLFRFDKRSILIDFGLSDSGGNRNTLDSSVERIVNTRFSLVSDSEALWLMQKLGLVDGNGNPYSKAPVRLIEEVGQTENADKGELDRLFKERGSLRYFDLALPSFLERQLNMSIEEWQKKIKSNISGNLPVLKMFTRDKRLLQGEEKGLIWLVNDHLSSKLARPGFSVGPVYLESFFNTFNASITSKQEILSIIKVLFHTLHNARHLLYCDDWQVNRRRQPRLKNILAIIDSKLLIAIDNVTPGYTQTTRISNLRYQFRAIRLTDSEAKVCIERNNLIKKNIEYAEDRAFVDIAETIFARSQITASQYK